MQYILLSMLISNVFVQVVHIIKLVSNFADFFLKNIQLVSLLFQGMKYVCKNSCFDYSHNYYHSQFIPTYLYIFVTSTSKMSSASIVSHFARAMYSSKNTNKSYIAYRKNVFKNPFLSSRHSDRVEKHKKIIIDHAAM